MRRILIISLISLTGLVASGQLKVTGAFIKDTVEIGQPVDFTLSIECSDQERVIAVSRIFLDSIYSALQTFKSNPDDTSGSARPQLADFEILNLGLWTDSGDDALFMGEELKWNISKVADRQLYENTFSLRLWDPGNNVILLPPVLYSTGSTQEQYYEGGQVNVYVAPPLSLQQANPDSIDVAPIKPILTEAKNLSDYLLIIYILGALLVTGIFYWLLKKYKGEKTKVLTEPEAPVIIIPAHEKAIKALQQLRREELWQKGEIKEYQSRLTFIIREYLENRYAVPALESTTDEIVRSLSTADLQSGDIASLKRILQVADLVKFAKARPDESVHDTFMTEAEEFVDRTREKPAEKEVKE